MSQFDQLTERQKEVYEFIRDKIRNRGYGPTVREIGDEFDISSPNGVMCHLKALEKKGLITREPNMSRAIQLAAEPIEERGLPLAGRIAAGVLHEAIEQDERVDFSAMFSHKLPTATTWWSASSALPATARSRSCKPKKAKPPSSGSIWKRTASASSPPTP
jgi:repressor LexA